MTNDERWSDERKKLYKQYLKDCGIACQDAYAYSNKLYHLWHRIAYNLPEYKKYEKERKSSDKRYNTKTRSLKLKYIKDLMRTDK